MMQMMRSLLNRKQRTRHTPSNSKECAVNVESMGTWPRIAEITEAEEGTLVEAVVEAMVEDLVEDPEEVVTGVTTRESRASASIVALLDTVKRTAERRRLRKIEPIKPLKEK